MLTNWEQVCGKSRDLGFSNLSFYINVTKLPNSTRVKFHSLNSTKYRSSQRRCPVRKGVLRNFAKFRPQDCNFIKKETHAQVFSCEFCEIFKNTFFREHLQETASEHNSYTHHNVQDFKQITQ